MQLICRFNKLIRFLFYVIDTLSKFSWLIPLKYKRNITITKNFQLILHESNHKPNKILVDEF